MSDETMREDVAKAIHESDGQHKWDLAHPGMQEALLQWADAAIAVVIEELAKEADHWCEHDWERPIGTNDFYGIARWLRSKAEPNTA